MKQLEQIQVMIRTGKQLHVRTYYGDLTLRTTRLQDSAVIITKRS